MPVFACLIATFCYGVAILFQKVLNRSEALAVAAGSQLVSSVVLLPLVVMYSLPCHRWRLGGPCCFWRWCVQGLRI